MVPTAQAPSRQREEAMALAEAVRAACLEAAREGYEQAGLAGLCAEGREDMALDAIRSLDLNALVQRKADKEPGTAMR